ncbi:MAG: hypothetical protein WCS52_10185 [bacterium]
MDFLWIFGSPVMQTHLHTMDQILATHEDIMSALLSRTGAPAATQN